MPSILLIVTGSIAAPKALDLCKILLKEGYNIEVILTHGAKEFVSEEMFEALAITNIFSNIFDAKMEEKIGHIELSRKSDLVLTYPASANFIAKIANGLADDLASTAILASNKKIFIAPAMNVEMWHNKIVKDNIVKIENRNIDVINPESGLLACGEIGEGRLKEPQDMYQIIENYFNLRYKLVNKNILITAGGTREKIDPVRYIGNFSSGKQGLAIAKKFREYGANVTLIAANINLHIPKNIKTLTCESAEQMSDLVHDQCKELKYDIAIFSAAVADYKVAEIAAQKIKKKQNDKLTLTLVKNPDILANISKVLYKPKVLIGFAAESENLEQNAKEKLVKKNCDYIVANNIATHEIFASDENNILFINKKESHSFAGTKERIAEFIIKNIFKVI